MRANLGEVASKLKRFRKAHYMESIAPREAPGCLSVLPRIESSTRRGVWSSCSLTSLLGAASAGCAYFFMRRALAYSLREGGTKRGIHRGVRS